MSFEQKRFLNCHSHATFARNNETGYVRVLAQSCHLRFCPICNRAREKLIRHNVADWLEKKAYPKFLTLTLKHSEDDLRTQIDKLYQCFRSLRRLKLIKKRVVSGIWFFQITRGQHGTEWHPHLHCILTGGYLPKRVLQQDWMRITGESFMVDIRLIHDLESAACEVARYCVCTCNVKTLDFNLMSELDTALRHRRICGTWGGARKQRLTSSPKYDPTAWTMLGSWSAVTGSVTTDKAARLIYSSWIEG
ncbi:MAG: protein rep, partial [Sedimentisphaerales bacterium]|nr:protein rep [Sedimentisphaerales bacterium]